MSDLPFTHVLDEDQHLDNLRKIIKRDFFSGEDNNDDDHLIVNANSNNINGHTLNTNNIPQSLSNPAKLTLNSYLANYQSNENQFFSELVHKDLQNWKKQHWWLQKDKQFQLAIEGRDRHKQIQQERGCTSQTSNRTQLAIPSQTDNSALKNGVLNVINDSIQHDQFTQKPFLWGQVRTEGSELSQNQKEKKILYQNCRLSAIEDHGIDLVTGLQFISDPNSKSKPNNSQSLVSDTFVPTGAQLAGLQPYGNLIEQPTPQAEAMHIFTWGSLQSTPLRIPILKQPRSSLRSAVGTQPYILPETPKRQQLLEQLNVDISRQKKSKTQGSASNSLIRSEMIGKIVGSARSAMLSASKRSSHHGLPSHHVQPSHNVQPSHHQQHHLQPNRSNNNNNSRNQPNTSNVRAISNVRDDRQSTARRIQVDMTGLLRKAE